MIKTLGVDIGIASIGWALVQGEVIDGKICAKEIIDSGVRIFTKAENPKDKSSLALPRRIARGARRRIRRKRARLLGIKNFLSNSMDIPLEDMLQEDGHPVLFRTSKDFLSPWTLRIEALHRCLQNDELARVILHIAKMRGYNDITYGLDGNKNNDDAKLTKAILQNKEELEKGGYQTIGEMMARRYFEQKREGSLNQWDNVRNRGNSENAYKRCVGRSELRKELEIIFAKQREFGNPVVTKDFEKKLLGDSNREDGASLDGLIFYQRPLKGFGDKVGDCQHIIRGDGRNPKRACKYAPSAEEFVAVSKIINFCNHCKNTLGDLTFDLAVVIEKCLYEARKKKGGLSYAKLREILAFPETFTFSGLDYADSKKDAEKKAFITLSGTYQLNHALGDLDVKLKDKVACIFGVNKDWNIIKQELLKIGMTDEQIQNLQEANLSFSSHINLSLEALYHILPLMKQGKRYDEAVAILEERGIFHKRKNQGREFLPPLSDLAKQDSYFDVTNPVVNRALSEFRKVLNAIIQKHGKFHYFNIELTRDVIKSKNQRNEIEKKQKAYEKQNEQAIQKLKEWGIEDNGKNRLKCRLWIQQNECCIYSGKKITRDDFLNQTIQIDHVFPRSRSLDDSQKNKVLCLTSSNQNKKDRTPYEWLKDDQDKWNRYVGYVLASQFDRSKKNKLIQKHFADRKVDEFLARNFVDTGYIGKLVKDYVREYLDFLPLPASLSNEGKEHVRIISGSLTSTLRSWWGVGQKDRNHHLHHAQDAIVIASIQPSTIKAYADFLKSKELHYKQSHEKMEALEKEGKFKTKLKMREPMENFKDKLSLAMQDIIVSHRVSRKVTGKLHKETIQKKEDFYQTYGGEDGVCKAIKLGKIREINEGIVENEEMVRVDIFKSKKGKFHVVPIYALDVAIGKLPNRAIVGGKDKTGIIKDWLEMDENFEFCFSLFKNDCVQIQRKEMQNPIFVIYSGTDACNATMSFKHISGCFEYFTEDEKVFFSQKNELIKERDGVGIQGLKIFAKAISSPLGEIKISQFNKRQAIKLKSSPKNV